MIGKAWRHALLDLRGSARHLRLLFICLALGVAVMSCIGSLIAGVRGGIDRDAKSLLGGDVEIRRLYKPVPYPVKAYFTFTHAEHSNIVDMRAMAENVADADTRSLIELKGIDAAYPLYGQMQYEQVVRKNIFFAHPERKLYGAAVDRSLLESLNIAPGGQFRIGDAIFVAGAVIAQEPDRSVSGLTLGPRVLTSKQAFRATGLMQPFSLINYRYRLKLPPDTDLAAWKARLTELFPRANWNIRDWHDSAPGLTTLIDRLGLFFALTGITALMVAGIGIGNAANVYTWSKREVIATLKCLGASQAYVRLLYLLQLLVAGSAAIACGLFVGVLAEWLLFGFLDNLLPVRGERGVYAVPLLLSAALGFVTLLLFSLLALSRLNAIRPASLFRGFAEVDATTPSPCRGEGRGGGWFNILSKWTSPHPNPPPDWGRELRDRATYVILILSLILLSILFTDTVKIPLYFAGGLLVSMGLFTLIGQAIRRLAAKAVQSGHTRLTTGMALANLARPGAATISITVALGIGMTLLVALALVGANLRRQLETGLPSHAPAFFLVDIQPSEREAVLAKLGALPEVQHLTDLPIVRGRIVKLNGVAVDKLSISENARWALQGERGLTWADVPPENAAIVAGKWWDKTYRGSPLVSFDAGLARGMGLRLGDTITVAALDREITATIASLRDIEWGTMEMNFAIILSPGALDGLPATYISTVTTPQTGEKAVQSLLAHEFPGIGIVRVRDALGKIAAMLGDISNAVLVTAGMTILCGMLVMAGAIHASLHRRQFDTVMLKVLGVTRRRILGIYLLEFALIAVAAAIAATFIGSLAAYGIMQLMIFSQFTLMPGIIAATLTGSLLFAILLGLAATRATLGVRPLSLLRNE